MMLSGVLYLKIPRIEHEFYLVVVGFAVGQALALIVAMSQEGLLTLCTHKMLQANPKAKHTWLYQPSLSASTVLKAARTLSGQCRTRKSCCCVHTESGGDQQEHLFLWLSVYEDIIWSVQTDIILRRGIEDMICTVTPVWRPTDGSERRRQAAFNSCLIASPYQSVFHNKRDHLARKTGGPERGARTRCTRGATTGGRKTGKLTLNFKKSKKKES